MTDSGILAVNTADPQVSIWLGLGLQTFRRNIANLKRVNEVPGARIKHNRIISAAAIASDKLYVLPFETERKLGDSFALLASFKEEARTVSAATLQEEPDGSSVTVRLAANQRLLPTVKLLFDTIIACLRDCAAQKLSREKCQQCVLGSIVKAHRRRIHGKLRSKLWKPSRSIEKERPQLHQQIHSFLSERGKNLPTEFQNEALKLRSLFQTADACVAETETEYLKLKDIVLSSYEFCLNMAKVLRTKDKEKIFDDSRLLSIKKLAHFMDMSKYMTDASRKYRQLFCNIRFEQLPAYKPVRLPTLPSSPPLNCYVHAEIQMITFYAQNPQINQKAPRVVGASKSACYLCSLFVHADGQFFISRTHGKLYDQWTIPDTFGTAELKDQRRRYRRVLGSINAELCAALKRRQQLAHHRRIKSLFPNESDATLPRDIPRSLLPSEAGTLRSHQSPATSVDVQTPRQSVLLLPEAPILAPVPRTATSSDRLKAPKEFTTGLNLDVHASDKLERQSSRSPSSSSRHSTRVTDSLAPTPQPQSIQILAPAIPSHSPSPNPLSDNHSVQPSPLETIVPPASPTTIDSLGDPFTHTITPEHPFRTWGQNMYLNVEMEPGGSSTGKVQITNAPETNSRTIRNTIDVRSITPGKSKLLQRSESEEELVVNLRSGEKGGMTQVTFRWE